MKTNTKLIAIFALVTVQNFVICQPSFANTCKELFPSADLSQNNERPALRLSNPNAEAQNNVTAITGIQLRVPTKISVLKGVKSFAPAGWDLTLKTQSLPVEIIRQYYSYRSDLSYDSGVRVWVDSDLGNANVNLYRAGRVEISLSSVMNSATAQRVLSYQEIVNRVKESSSQTTADIDALDSAGALKIRSDGIIIWKEDLNFIESRNLKVASQRLTQTIVDFLQQTHPDIRINSRQDSYYANKHLAHKEIANYIQSELAVMPSPDTKDVFGVKDLLDPQENRPAFYSRYVVHTKGIGEVRMLLGNDDFSPAGFQWIIFKPTKKGDTVPSEKKIREILGTEVSSFIERISTNSSGGLEVHFSESRRGKVEIARQMVFRLVSALKDGSLVDSSAP